MDAMERKMSGQSRPSSISTRLHRVAQVSRERPSMVWTTLAHHVDVDLLAEAYRSINKSGAAGIDGVTAAEYEANLEGNLASLHQRFHDGRYRAPPVRRVYIPKGSGQERRPIGIPTLEDKVLQYAVTMVLNAVYEQDFLDCSYGFRPGRSAHQALQALRDSIMETWGGWVIELDIASFFDTLDHAHLRSFLEQRIRDGVILRAIGKWLNAGVIEVGAHLKTEQGSPQGGVISPLLANIYLHHVLDVWFAAQVRPRMRGAAQMCRYADDAVLVFECREDAERVFSVLPQRFERYGLTLHPEKTRLIQFRQPPRDGPDKGNGPGSFDFLGFTHYWGPSHRGVMVVQRRTSKKSFRRSLRAISDWCKEHRHSPLAMQQRMLTQKLLGHFRYFGVVGNIRQLDRLVFAVQVVWHKWLARRSARKHLHWERFNRLLRRYPLPLPRIYHAPARP